MVHDPYLFLSHLPSLLPGMGAIGNLTFSPFISFCSHFLLPPFCLSCKEEPELHRKELFAPEPVMSFWSTCISFNFMVSVWSLKRCCVHATQAAEFQFHRNHQSFRLLGWMLASLWWVTRPWMWTFREDGVPSVCQVKVQIYSLLSLVQTGLSLLSPLFFFYFGTAFTH